MGVLADKSSQFSSYLLALAKQMKGEKTIIVHPQVASSKEEASTLASNWKARENKQVITNLVKTLR